MAFIDLRSDTVTWPTEAMREAMSKAPVGDDVYGEDPTVNQLEELAARTLGKEAAVFVPSGTMGNQVAIMAQTRPGDEIIAAAASHIVQNEAGGAARLSGVSCALANHPEGRVSADDVHRLVRPTGNVHYPRSSLVCLENALGCGGVVTVEEMKAVYQTAKEYGLSVHLDGARLFNAAAALGVPASALSAWTDTVCFCISKGLCAPIGSLVCGSSDFADEVRRCRKVLGGGMRQAGVLAACGLIALRDMTSRLSEDHDNARYLGALLSEIPGVLIDRESIKINMVFWRAEAERFDDQAYIAFMLEKGIQVSPSRAGLHRLVTHNYITRGHVETYAAALKDFIGTT